MLTTEIITRYETLAPLHTEWNRLASLEPCAEPFMNYEWLTTCAQNGPYRIEPFVIAVRRNNTVLGIGPFGRLGRIKGRRRILYMGAGPSDYQGLLTDPACSDAEALIIRTLLAHSGWDWIDLDPITENQSVLWRALSEQDALKTSWQVKGSYPYIDLSSSHSGALNVIKKADYEWRRLQRQGILQFRDIREGLDELIDSMATLHIERWNQAGAKSRFERSDIVKRFKRLSAVWDARGILDAKALYLDDTLIAAHIGAKTFNRYFYHTPVFDIRYSKHSPGNILLRHLIRMAQAEGLEVFDFLRGDEDYKQRWNAEQGPRYGKMRIVKNRSSRLPELSDHFGQFLKAHPKLQRTGKAIKSLIGE